MTGIEALQSV